MCSTRTSLCAYVAAPNRNSASAHHEASHRSVPRAKLELNFPSASGFCLSLELGFLSRYCMTDLSVGHVDKLPAFCRGSVRARVLPVSRCTSDEENRAVMVIGRMREAVQRVTHESRRSLPQVGSRIFGESVLGDGPEIDGEFGGRLLLSEVITIDNDVGPCVDSSVLGTS